MNRKLLDRQLGHILDGVSLLERNARLDDLADDPVQRAFVARTLQTAIQAAVDVASTITAAFGLGPTDSDLQAFEKLANDRWLPEAAVERWALLVQFRDDVVHGYLDLDSATVATIARDHRDALREFVHAVRSRMDPAAEDGPGTAAATASPAPQRAVRLRPRTAPLHGSTSNCTRPASIDYDAVRARTSEWQAIRRDRVPRHSARYQLIAGQIHEKIRAACRTAGHAAGYDCVVRAEDQLDTDGLQVPDITEAVAAALEG